MATITIIEDERELSDLLRGALESSGQRVVAAFDGPEGARRCGSGLGLAIVKDLVEAQGGTIDAESVPGEGTTIRFTSPRAR